jgi:hypothetical protein
VDLIVHIHEVLKIFRSESQINVISYRSSKSFCIMEKLLVYKLIIALPNNSFDISISTRNFYSLFATNMAKTRLFEFVDLN